MLRATMIICLSPVEPWLDEANVDALENAGIDRTKVRSAITRIRYGVCANVMGVIWQEVLVNIGEAVGVIAAQSIGEPGLTMRTFHIGGSGVQGRCHQSYSNQELGRY